MANSAQMTVYKRLTVVDRIGTDGSDGESLKGQNVNLFPEGSLFFAVSSNRLYRLRKNLDPAVIADAGVFKNVVDGIGSSSAAGRFVAVNQYAEGGLESNEGGSTIAIDGFDLSLPGAWLTSYVTPGGTQGFLHAQATGGTSLVEVTITSSSSTDTSIVLVEYLSEPTG